MRYANYIVDGSLELEAEDRSKVVQRVQEQARQGKHPDRVQDRSVMPSWPHHSRSRFNSTVDRFRHVMFEASEACGKETTWPRCKTDR